MSPNPIQFNVGYLASDSIFHLKELLTKVHGGRQVSKQFFQTSNSSKYATINRTGNGGNNMAKFIDYQLLISNTFILKLNENTSAILPVGIP